MFWPYGRYEALLHRLNLDWLVRIVKKNTEDIEEIKEHGGGGGVTPVITASATVDNNTGTPSVSVQKSGTDEAPNFAFNFRNLKGATGATGRDGNDGITPDISASATVDNTSGTPNVSVSKSGSTANPSFTFAFTGLKGAKGDTGNDGQPGTPGTPGAPGARGSDFWRASTVTYNSGRYRAPLSGLTGSVDTPKTGDVMFNSFYYYVITDIDATYAYAAARTSIQGPQGNQGNPGQGVPAGGTAGQVLSKIDGTDYNCQWVNAGGGGGSVPSYIFTSNSTPDDEAAIMASLNANRIPPFADSQFLYTNVVIEDSNLNYISGGMYSSLGEMMLASQSYSTMRIRYYNSATNMLAYTVEIEYSSGSITNIMIN
jgi:hypothetical protein